MSHSRLVYSTDFGTACPTCRRPEAACTCHRREIPAAGGLVKLSREKRRGKVVSLINGLPLDDAALQALGKQLKALCGSGGTVKDGTIEIQGDHVDALMAHLSTRPEGWKLKRVGG